MPDFDVFIPRILGMDEIELLVAETFKHFHENYDHSNSAIPALVVEDAKDLLPEGPGLLYHLQKTTSLFVIRTFVSKNILKDYSAILEAPENYPSLRLLEGGEKDITKKLRFFTLEDYSQAEIIQDQLANRRFPVNEEMMCNLSDPGFSWWLHKDKQGFNLSFNLSSADIDSVVKLGPLGDQQLAMANFQLLEKLSLDSGLDLNLQNETNRVQLMEGEEVFIEELKDLFEIGVMGETLIKLFKLLAKRTQYQSQLETLWFYFQEIAAIRRFWIQIQYDLDA
jgi:hypothetical protein